VDIFVERHDPGYSVLMSLKMGALASTVLLVLAPITVLAQSATTTATTSIATSTLSNADVEARVESYFADIPVMIPIAKCESNFRQFDMAGALSGGTNGGMVGIFQINAAVHKTFANSLGMDITTTDGNLAYARYLYEQEGTAPWNSSSACWKNAISKSAGMVATSTENYSPQQTAQIAQLRIQIATLQKILTGLLQSRNAVAHLN
jgi:hypothetical protein